VTSSVSLTDLLQGATPLLDDLVDRDALGEVLESFYNLFRIPVRIFNADGLLLADAHGSTPRLICDYVDGFPAGRSACETTVNAVKSAQAPLDQDVTHPCFTGAAYKLFAVVFDGRAIGKVVMGPYLPAEVREVPRSLTVLHPRLDARRAETALSDLPRVRPETAGALIRHLRGMLDVILFSGHRALLMSQMHVASVRESYRELQAKNTELARSYERLKELDRLKSNFLATVSHELRTPLTSIIGYSEMLSEGIGGALSAEQAEFVKTIREKGEQLLTLITSLLDLAKLEQGTISMTPGAVPLASLASEVVSTFVPSARRKRVHLKVEADPTAPDAMGDRERLRQVLTNLVDNALKFTPAGGQVTVRIRPTDPMSGAESGGGDDDDGFGLVLMAPAKRDVEVRIEDTGIGIPAHLRDRVFDAFYQVDSSSTREYGGTGLGLSIVKRIIESHHGKVFVDGNEDSRGVAFVIRLPAVQP
jgi:signal transduction histidine kinase